MTCIPRSLIVVLLPCLSFTIHVWTIKFTCILHIHYRHGPGTYVRCVSDTRTHHRVECLCFRGFLWFMFFNLNSGLWFWALYAISCLHFRLFCLGSKQFCFMHVMYVSFACYKLAFRGNGVCHMSLWSDCGLIHLTEMNIYIGMVIYLYEFKMISS